MIHCPVKFIKHPPLHVTILFPECQRLPVASSLLLTACNISHSCSKVALQVEPRTSISESITWDLVRNANSWILPWVYHVRLWSGAQKSVSANSLGDSDMGLSLRTTVKSPAVSDSAPASVSTPYPATQKARSVQGWAHLLPLKQSPWWTPLWPQIMY